MLKIVVKATPSNARTAATRVRHVQNVGAHSFARGPCGTMRSHSHDSLTSHRRRRSSTVSFKSINKIPGDGKPGINCQIKGFGLLYVYGGWIVSGFAMGCGCVCGILCVYEIF